MPRSRQTVDKVVITLDSKAENAEQSDYPEDNEDRKHETNEFQRTAVDIATDPGTNQSEEDAAENVVKRMLRHVKVDGATHYAVRWYYNRAVVETTEATEHILDHFIVRYWTRWEPREGKRRH